MILRPRVCRAAPRLAGQAFLRGALPRLLAVTLALPAAARGGEDLPAAEGSPAEKDIAAGNLEFALDLYDHLRGEEGNLFASPHSISSALAMTRAGARSRTAEQMDRVLRFGRPGEALHEAFAELRSELREIAEEEETVRIDIANSLWPERTFPFRADFTRRLERWYGVSVTPVDYRNAADRARSTINEWVEEQTAGKIEDLVPPGVLDEMTRLVLVNAIYFQGGWSNPFQAERTEEAPFHPEDGPPVAVDMMRQEDRFPTVRLERCRLLELPYGERRALSMVVLLPAEGESLSDLESRLDAGRLTAWLGKLRTTRLDLQLPRFRFTSEFRLDKALQAMGMRDAFSKDRADFSGMHEPPPPLFIGAVLHKTFVDVSEKGTEAAAATAVTVRPTSTPHPPEPFIVDRPFLFLIRERSTGAVLFLGRFTGPEG